MIPECSRVLKWCAFGLFLALVAMGCVYFHSYSQGCPSASWWQDVFVRQILWHLAGVAVLAVVATIRWDRWLRSAPWLLALCCGMFLCARLGQEIGGSCRWLAIGPMRIDLYELSVILGPLFVTWLMAKRKVPQVVVTALVGLVATLVVVWSFGDVNRIRAFLHPDEFRFGLAWMQSQFVSAFEMSKWFESAGYDLTLIPKRLTDGLLPAAALLLGKWFPVTVCTLYCLLCAVFGFLWLKLRGNASRVFVLLWGGILFVRMFYGFFQCFGWLPVLAVSPALISYGGTSAVLTWCGLGLTFSLMDECED